MSGRNGSMTWPRILWTIMVAVVRFRHGTVRDGDARQGNGPVAATRRGFLVTGSGLGLGHDNAARCTITARREPTSNPAAPQRTGYGSFIHFIFPETIYASRRNGLRLTERYNTCDEYLPCRVSV